MYLLIKKKNSQNKHLIKLKNLKTALLKSIQINIHLCCDKEKLRTEQLSHCKLSLLPTSTNPTHLFIKLCINKQLQAQAQGKDDGRIEQTGYMHLSLTFSL